MTEEEKTKLGAFLNFISVLVDKLYIHCTYKKCISNVLCKMICHISDMLPLSSILIANYSLSDLKFILISLLLKTVLLL